MDPYQTKLQPAWFGQFGGSVVFKLQLLSVVMIDLVYGGSNVCLLSQASPCNSLKQTAARLRVCWFVYSFKHGAREE